jgi:hypothetical protein
VISDAESIALFAFFEQVERLLVVDFEVAHLDRE